MSCLTKDQLIQQANNKNTFSIVVATLKLAVAVMNVETSIVNPVLGGAKIVKSPYVCSTAIFWK
jgi:hypothetical protein